MELRIRTGPRVGAALAAGGACAVSAQIVLLRELLVAAQGNELSLAIILAGWLFWGAAGSWLVGGRADRFRHPVAVLAVLLALASVLLPATVFASGCVKKALGASAVETLGFIEFLPASIVLVGPLCFVLGSVFAIGARILDELAPARNEVSRAYLLESAGAGLGGLVISLWVLPRTKPLALSFALAAALMAVSFFLAGGISSRRRRATLRVSALVMIVAFAAGAVRYEPDWLRRRLQWHGFRLIEARNSLFGSLAAIDLQGQVSVYQNGLVAATGGYRRHAEELVHLGMAQHANPRSVLLLGGGLDGSLDEILKHPIDHCHYVELDPVLLTMGRRHLPREDLAALDDPRVTVHHMDGRYFVKNAPRKYDVILLDLPGPRSAQLNRFYSVEFFREARRALRPGGVLAFEIASSEASPTPEQRLLLASTQKTAGLAFPRVALLPGETCYFVLSAGPSPTTQADAILARLDAAKIERQYVDETLLPFRLTDWRAGELEEALAEKEKEARINEDFRPLGYLYDLAQWSAQFRGPGRRWVGKIVAADARWAYLLPVALLPLLAAVKYAIRLRPAPAAGTRSRKDAPEARLETPALPILPSRFAIGAAVGVTGISEIIFQITVLVGFQVMYGYLFYRLGIMVAAFMAGLAAGSFWLWRQGPLPPIRAWRRFLWAHVAILAYPLLLPLLFRFPPPSRLFMFLPAVAGLLGGLEFPLAVRLWRHHGTGVGAAAGGLYGLDLLGACLGALVVSPFLIPLMGLVGMCWWTALLNAAVLILLVLPSPKPRGPA